MLDRKTKELMDALEASERARLSLEDEAARMRGALLEELSAASEERDGLGDQAEALMSELDAAQRALRVEREERAAEVAAASELLADMDDGVELLRDELEVVEAQVVAWRHHCLRAEREWDCLKLEGGESVSKLQVTLQRAIVERRQAEELATLRYRELQARLWSFACASHHTHARTPLLVE